MTDYRDGHEPGAVRTPRGTRVTPEDSRSATWLAEETHREAISQSLFQLGAWLAEHPEARKNLKPIRNSRAVEPGVYYNLGTGMVDRVYRPQRVALGHKMFRVTSDPAAPVEEIRRRIMEGK